MRRLKTIPLIDDNRAASYTISALIMTTITITLVVAASFYALQVLDQQRGAAEYQIVVKSILAFDDGLENVAWKVNGTLSSRFTVQYGELRIFPETKPAADTVQIYGNVGGTSWIPLYSNRSCVLSYFLSTRYVTYGEPYKSYILGDPSALIVGSQGTFGRAVVMQQRGWVNVTLDTRMRAMLTSRVRTTSGNYVNYLDIWVIRTVVQPSLRNYTYYGYLHDFDLKARSLRVQTNTYGQYGPVGAGVVRLNVTAGKTVTNPPATFNIVAGDYVVFNVIVATVQVYA